ncbi:ATP12 family protein [Shimia sp.]|uniref:ATP12 family chaperone protein n=1 Tax=Shimia sp. TaxID=1954381 RepID=UPI00329706EE
MSSEWAQKRFWKLAEVTQEPKGFSVKLDGRALKTPAKAALIVPSRVMAESIAAEWNAQTDKIDPGTMPVTRSANAAIDKVATQHSEVADLLAEYGGSDLLCYRATSPQELIERQAENWDPLLDWSANVLAAPLESVSGVMHMAQNETSLANLRNRVHALDNFQLAAFHDLVSLSGSLVLGFAALLDFRPIDELWQLSRIDETWQEEQWGVDEEAQMMASQKYHAFIHAYKFAKMLY